MKRILIFLAILVLSIFLVFICLHTTENGTIEIIEDSKNENVVILGVYGNYTYGTTKIIPIYNDGKVQETLLTALKTEKINLEEILKQMDKDKEYKNIYKYNGNSKLGKDKFTIKICNNYVLFLPYNISNKEYNCKEKY